MLPAEFEATLWDIRISAVNENHQLRRTLELVFQAPISGALQSEMGEWGTMVGVLQEATAKSMTLETSSDEHLLGLVDVDDSVDAAVALKNTVNTKAVLKVSTDENGDREVTAVVNLTAPLDEAQLVAASRLLRRVTKVSLEARQQELPGMETATKPKRRKKFTAMMRA